MGSVRVPERLDDGIEIFGFIGFVRALYGRVRVS